MSKANKALPFLLVDVNTQNDFWGAEACIALMDVDRIRKNIKDLADKIRKAKLPVLAAVDFHDQNAPEFVTYQLPPHALAGTVGQEKIYETHNPAAKIIPISGQRRPWPKISEVISSGGQLILEKVYFDLFTNPACREVLDGFKTHRLVFFGATLEHDIYASALSARTLGFAVTIVIDAVGTTSEQAKEMARAGLLKRGVTFHTTAEILGDISQWMK